MPSKNCFVGVSCFLDSSAEGGRVVHDTSHIIDVMPTFLEVAGAEYPATFDGHDILPCEGLSLMPILTEGTREGHETLCWEHEGNRAVRRGKWKLVSRFPLPWELFDMEADRTELNDLAEAERAIVADLSARYEAWAKRCGVRFWGDFLTERGLPHEQWGKMGK